MRAYLAILKDSFRESLRSRVLWMLLIAITFILLLIVPLNIQQKSNWRLAIQDITNGREFARLFIEQAASGQHLHVTRFWESLESDAVRQRWQERYAPTDDSPREKSTDHIHGDLNHVLERDDLYDATVWKTRTLPDDISELIERRDRGESIDTLELNRRLFEDAFPSYIQSSGGASYFLSYFAWEVPAPIATNHNQLRLITNLTISVFISFVIGTAGVFIAILVTASMIPNTYANGSIDLLLSKPIARPLLYLTKFFGGCIFILLNTTYFLIGFWLILGLRLGIWTNRIIWCIPVFLFLFAIYYSVSALAGVIWRNTIICVVASFLFWLTCFIVGNARESIEMFFLQPTRLKQLTPAGDGFMAITTAGGATRWDAATRNWRSVTDDARPRGGPPFHGNSSNIEEMVYDPEAQRILAIRRRTDRVIVARAEDDFHPTEGAALPLGAKHIYLNSDGSLHVVCTHGIFHVRGDLETASEPDEPLTIGGFSLPIRRSQPFTPIAPSEWTGMGINFSVARNPISTSMAIHDRGTVTVLDQAQTDKAYACRFTLELDGEQEAKIGLTDQTIVVARRDGLIRLIDVPSHSVASEFTPFVDEHPEQIVVSPDGRWFFILFTSGNAALIDADTQQIATVHIPSQGKITAAAFASGGDQLFIVDHRSRVVEWSIDTNQRNTIVKPTSSTFETVYYWVINPLYKVFPKPAELTTLVQYLLKDPATSGAFGRGDFGPELTRSEIWNPIWSNLAFVTAVLLIGCVYVTRKEF